MENQEDTRRAMREMMDEMQRTAETATRLVRQAAEDMGKRWRGGPAGPRSESFAETIRELGKLRDEGYITEDEYQAKKRELLERI